MAFAIFLDIDGVLNTRNTGETTPNNRVGIDDSRVKILAGVITKYREPTEIILTSDWKDFRPDNDDYKYLISKLEKFKLKLSGKTTDNWKKRGEGVQQYLMRNPQIKEYVILDDNLFDFEDYTNLWERLLVCTSGIEGVRFASESPAVEAILFRDYLRELI